MAAFRDPLQLGPEPFENQFESQVRLSSATHSSSSDALNAFYADMERKLSAERALSKGKSIWSRKSAKKLNDNAPSQDSIVQKVPSALHALPAPENNISQTSLPPDGASTPLAQSIIPDVSIDNPQWEAKELEWATTSAIAFSAKHPIHNPMGPRYYKNHHIIPPHAKRDNRPPSIFSPSFPPMAPSLHTRSQDSSWALDPSRSPSGSPLPTPQSSQTRIHDPSSKSRSRNTSQTAHDNVDLLDVSDPWGQAWHHQSPYDVGLTRTSVEGRESPTSPVSPVAANNHTRSRRSSLTTHSRHKTVAPSPLSQSTSAVHLRSLQTDNAQITRRLSKHRKPFRGLFSSNDLSSAVSAGDLLKPVQPTDGKLARKLSKRSSTSAVSRPFVSNQQSLSSSATWQGDKKERRGSILVRLARRFSIARRSDSDKRASSSVYEDWYYVTHSEPEVNGTPGQVRSSSLEKQRDSRRIPAPTLEQELSDSNIPSPPPPEPGGRSSASLDLETPITLGRLTIANPDDPTSSTTTSPVLGDISLPPIIYPSSPPGSSAKARSSLYPEDTPPPVPSKSNTPFHPAIPLEPTPSLEPPVSSPQPPPQAEIQGPPVPLPFTPSPDPIEDAQPTQLSAESSPSLSALAAPTLLYVAPAQEIDDSPLSRASLFVNPPTPHVPSNGIMDPSRSVQELNSTSENSDGPKIRTSSSGKIRQTETFKLVRSPSENIYTNGQTIMAGGEHWEVIDASSGGPKRSTSGTATAPATKEQHKSQIREDETSHGKRESRRHEKEKSKRESYYPDGTERHRSRDDDNSRHKESRRHEKERSKRESWYRRDSTEKRSPRENDSHSKKESRRSQKSKAESSRQPDNRDKLTARQPTPSSSSSSVPRTSTIEPSKRSDRTRSSKNHSRQSLDDTKSSRPVRSGEPNRQPSLSARPTSEVHPAAELNNVRAREAWEMDRLWKGRSMSIGREGSNIISTPGSTGNELDRHMQEDLQRSNSSGHGSSRTYFVVQTPFQAPAVSSPAPVLYSRQASTLAFPTISTSSTYPRNINPPPEPIRANPYQLAPLPPSLASLDDPTSREYWAKLAGVPAHH